MNSSREREIFEACLELSTEEREEFITERCGDDQALADRVRRLLDAHERALEGPTSLNPTGAAALLDDPKEIGPYRILERIGEGGMGVVYVAEQTRPIKRIVALKVIKLGMDTKHVIARFDSERQALALMNHPNIARILDAGATDTGRPYFVMEYVRGTSVLEYCDRRRLTVQERLRLFADVCHAVEHAHQKGVIHRDLKRTNILVTEESDRPYPKVIDFGIAKATSQRLTDMTLHTKLGHVVGTPEYMSPEQAGLAPSDLDPRTDIYSLGVVLYELVSGLHPFDFRNADVGPDEIMRTIRDVEPPAPSNRLADIGDLARVHATRRSSAPGTLIRELRGGLDWITMKALAKDRNQRYESAAAFATDVQSYLSGTPVSATSPGLWHRTRKGLQRYRAAAVAAALVVLLALAVTVGMRLRSPAGTPTRDGPTRVLVLPFEFLGPSEDAYLAEGVSEEISDRLSGLTNLTVLGRQTAVYASSEGLSLDEMATELDADFILDGTVRLQRVSDGPDQMRIRAALTSTESLSQLWTDTYNASASDLFGVQVDVAAQVVEAVGVELPIAEQRFLATQLTENAEAYDYFLRGNDYSRRSELEPALRTALGFYEQAANADSNFTAAWAAASIMRSRIRWRGYDQSVENLDRARDAGERALELQPDEADGHLALGYYHYYRFRDYASATTYFRAAVDRRPNDPETLYALGLVSRRQGNWDQALAALQDALDANPRYADAAITLGETHLALGEYAEAEDYFDRALAFAPDRPGIYLFKAWLYLASEPDIGAAVAALEASWDKAGGPAVFGLLGSYPSSIDWWLSRVLASDERYQRMFLSADLSTVPVDSTSYYLHRAQFYDALRNGDLSAAYADSARTLLDAATAELGAERLDAITAMESVNHAIQLAHLGLAHAGLGNDDEALEKATAGMTLNAQHADALHGSEVPIQLGLIQVLVGDSEGAVGRLAKELAKPSAFRVEMLRHDPLFAPLLEDARLRGLVVN